MKFSFSEPFLRVTFKFVRYCLGKYLFNLHPIHFLIVKDFFLYESSKLSNYIISRADNEGYILIQGRESRIIANIKKHFKQKTI